jgi:hypothetical protein
MAARRTRRKAAPALTARDVKQRAKAAGIRIPDDEVEPILLLMNNALEPVRSLDTTADRTREPAVIFRP